LHARYYLTLAQSAEPELYGLRQETWLDRLEEEVNNLREALNWSLDQGEIKIGIGLAGSLWNFWTGRGLQREGMEYVRKLLELRPDEIGGMPLARALYAAGQLSYTLGDFMGVKEYAQESLELYRQFGGPADTAMAFELLSAALVTIGELQQAEAVALEGLALSRGANDRRAMAYTLLVCGAVPSTQGKNQDAIVFFREGLTLAQGLGDARLIAYELTGLGTAETNLGEY